MGWNGTKKVGWDGTKKLSGMGWDGTKKVEWDGVGQKSGMEWNKQTKIIDREERTIEKQKSEWDGKETRHDKTRRDGGTAVSQISYISCKYMCTYVTLGCRG